MRGSPRRGRGVLTRAMILLLSTPLFSAFAQTAAGPLIVSGPRVVFFGPNRAERDSIARDEGLEIDDLMDDFNYYAGKAAVFLSRAGIPSEFTDSPTVVLKVGASVVRTFDRKSIQDPVGMILTDGVREPRVVPGAGTDRDLILQIKEYFHLNQAREE